MHGGRVKVLWVVGLESNGLSIWSSGLRFGFTVGLGFSVGVRVQGLQHASVRGIHRLADRLSMGLG